MTDSAAPAILPKQEAAGIDLSGFKLISQGAEAVSMSAYTFGTLAMDCMLSHHIVSAPICLSLHMPQRVWEGTYLDVPAVIKQRFSKKYRHASLDTKLTQSRLKQVLHV